MSPLVMHSPLPPRKSGIASYTAELLPALCALRETVLVCEEGDTAQTRAGLGFSSPHLRLLTPAQYAGEHALQRAPHVYQIGNNADHVFVYEAFRRRPGVLVQHDFNLHYLLDDVTLARGDVDGYRRVLQEEYGPPGATLADLRQLGVFSEVQKLSLPVNRHLLSAATGVIVHNRWVYDRLPEAVQRRTCVMPHHYSPLVDGVRQLHKAAARERVGLDADAFVLLSLGFITPPKQIQTTLAALARLRRGGARFHYVIAGERNAGFDIDGHIHQHGLQDCVTITGYLPEDRFFEHIVAADCLVNLRHPTVGESSGTLSRALALGLPAVVYNFGPLSEFDDDIVVKVPLELGEPLRLAAALRMLMDEPAKRAEIGRRARSHMRAHCSVERSAAAYLAFIDGLAGGAGHEAA